GAIVSTAFGVLTMFADGIIPGPGLLRTALDWYASDIIGLLTICPFLLIFVAPSLSRWLGYGQPGQPRDRLYYGFASIEGLEQLGQTLAVVGAIWALFCVPAAMPYQPLYLLFVPLVWASLRRGTPGAAFITFVLSVGIAMGAGLTHAPVGSLPQLQLAALVFGLTGLCMGAVVSERRQAERDLRHSEKGLKESQRVASLGSWTLNLSTGQVTWTEELYRMFGLAPSLAPPSFSEHGRLFSEESWDQLKKSVDKTLITGDPYELELQTVRPDGSRGWIRARGEVQKSSNGAVKSLCGIAQDITERKQTEEALSF